MKSVLCVMLCAVLSIFLAGCVGTKDTSQSNTVGLIPIRSRVQAEQNDDSSTEESDAETEPSEIEEQVTDETSDSDGTLTIKRYVKGVSSDSSVKRRSLSSSANSGKSSMDSYDEGYDDIYDNDDYDWDRYQEDDDYAEGVDDAMDELEDDW